MKIVFHVLKYYFVAAVKQKDPEPVIDLLGKPDTDEKLVSSSAAPATRKKVSVSSSGSESSDSSSDSESSSSASSVGVQPKKVDNVST